VLCEGSGHAGVGSVFDLSNARVAQILHAKVIIVSRGGIGKPIDEVCLNQALFEKVGVEIIGIILNKVMPDKMEYITEFARRGLKRKGLDLLGVLPHNSILTKPTMELICEELRAELLNRPDQLGNMVNTVVVGAMGVQNAMNFFKQGVLIIAPGDREDIMLAAAANLLGQTDGLAGIVLTDNLRPSQNVLNVIAGMPFPVLLAAEDSYHVASRVHDLIVKTRPKDTEKISVIRDLIAEHVDVQLILDRL
jgi:BioD-like phosphotransacetylase family protein